MATREQLNFVFFQPDEMRAESLACYGLPLIKTPHYDRLAEEGVRFEQCHVQNAQCVPSRTSMMTGLYPHCTGHRSNWHLLRAHEPHLFKYLYEGRYDIHWFGKNDLLARESLFCIKEFCEPEGAQRRNPYRLDDKEYYSFDFEPLETAPLATPPVKERAVAPDSDAQAASCFRVVVPHGHVLHATVVPHHLCPSPRAALLRRMDARKSSVSD